MNKEKIIRLIAGIFILVSIVLTLNFGNAWLWMTAFVGANLFQSTLTGFCPLEKILVALKIGEEPRIHPSHLKNN